MMVDAIGKEWVWGWKSTGAEPPALPYGAWCSPQLSKAAKNLIRGN
jgi:hypothetical protein